MLPERILLVEDFATGGTLKGVKSTVMRFKSPGSNKEPLTGRTVAVLSDSLMRFQRILLRKLFATARTREGVQFGIVLRESIIVDDLFITRRTEGMPSSMLMLLERILPGKLLAAVTTLKRVVGFIVLTVMDKESITKRTKAMACRTLSERSKGNSFSQSPHSNE